VRKLVSERGARHASAVAVGNVGFAARSHTSLTHGFKTFLGRYFYFCMALLMAGLVVWGFPSRQDHSCCGFTARPSRPGSCCSSRSLA
jgi:hypothetical protein